MSTSSISFPFLLFLLFFSLIIFPCLLTCSLHGQCEDEPASLTTLKPGYHFASQPVLNSIDTPMIAVY